MVVMVLYLCYMYLQRKEIIYRAQGQVVQYSPMNFEEPPVSGLEGLLAYLEQLQMTGQAGGSRM